MDLLSEFSAYKMPVAEIYLEPMFNCREAIALISVEELASAINAHGLQFPLSVQPKEDCENIPEGFNYRLIVGFRRFNACSRILKWTHIPAVIRRGLSDRDARVMNLTENIDRRDLNILEEAKALAAIFKPGTPMTQVSSSIRRHKLWCTIRYALLRIPEEAQQAAASGAINQEEIQLIASVAPDCQLSVFRRILEKRIDWRTKGNNLKRRPPDRRPPEEEINKRFLSLVDRGLGGFLGRLLMWAGGQGISNDAIDQELHTILEKYEKHGIISAEDVLGASGLEVEDANSISKQEALSCKKT